MEINDAFKEGRMFNSKRTITATLITTAMMGTPAIANSAPATTKQAAVQASVKTMQPVSRMSVSQNTWITLTGEVTAVDSQFFTLDYGDGEIFVELSQTKLDPKAYAEIDGKEVMVTAQLDEGMMSNERLVAHSVIAEDADTVYMADTVDQASADLFMSTAGSIDFDDAEMIIVGTVETIGREAVQVKVGDAMLTVELDELEDAPVDSDGYLTLTEGERVRITGELEEDFFNRFTVEADTLMKMKS